MGNTAVIALSTRVRYQQLNRHSQIKLSKEERSSDRRTFYMVNSTGKNHTYDKQYRKAPVKDARATIDEDLSPKRRGPRKRIHATPSHSKRRQASVRTTSKRVPQGHHEGQQPGVDPQHFPQGPMDAMAPGKADSDGFSTPKKDSDKYKCLK